MELSMRISMYFAGAAAVLVWSGSAMAEQGMISTGQDLKQIEQDKKIDQSQQEQTGRSAGPAAEQQTYEQQQQQGMRPPEGAVPPPPR
jgi:hypothetical protein